MLNCYKGNLHMHTTLSDGALTPEEAVLKYKKAGYDFLALTDHWVQSENGYMSGVTMLSGCEYDFGRNTVEGVYHVVGIGFESDPESHAATELKPLSKRYIRQAVSLTLRIRHGR